MGNTVISSSIDITHTLATNSPAYGEESVIEGSIKKGVQRQTYVFAVDACEGNDASSDLGDKCKIFGENMTGDCIVVSQQTSSIGGTSSRPYVQKTIQVIGLSHG